MTLTTNVVSNASTQITALILNGTVLDTYAVHFHWEHSLVDVIKVTVQLLAALIGILIAVVAHNSNPDGSKIGQTMVDVTPVPTAAVANAAGENQQTVAIVETKKIG